MTIEQYRARLRRKADAATSAMTRAYLESVQEDHRRGTLIAAGRTYILPGGIPYRASAPGQPPAVRPAPIGGKLLAAMNLAKVRPLVYQAGVDDSEQGQIAIYLEYGTNKMAPRPLWRFNLEQMKSSGELSQAYRKGFR